MAWRALAYQDGVPETALVIGLAGEIPSATADDQADFYMVVPFDMVVKRLKATAATAPSTNTELTLRRSTDNGATFSTVTGRTVTINNGDHLGENDVTDQNVNQGDILNFSVTSGGGSGENLALFVIGSK